MSDTEQNYLFIGLKNGGVRKIIGEYVQIKGEINSALHHQRYFIEVADPSLKKGYIKVSEICTLNHTIPKQNL